MRILGQRNYETGIDSQKLLTKQAGGYFINISSISLLLPFLLFSLHSISLLNYLVRFQIIFYILSILVTSKKTLYCHVILIY